MRFNYLFPIVFGLVIASCDGNSKSSKSSDNVAKRKKQTKVDEGQINSENTKAAKDTIRQNTQLPESGTQSAQFRLDLIKCTYTGNNRVHTLLIHANVVTFYIQNNDQDGVKKLRNAGFPMEFWSTGMCAFYGIKASDLKRHLKKAEQLGFKAYGYQCIDNDGAVSETRILGNGLIIRFNPIISKDEIAEIIGPHLDYTQGFTNMIYARVTDKSARGIVKQYNRLKAHKDVESVDFLFETCDYRIPVDAVISH